MLEQKCAAQSAASRNSRAQYLAVVFIRAMKPNATPRVAKPKKKAGGREPRDKGARALRARRRELKLSIPDAAQLAGVDKRIWVRWENGALNLETLQIAAKALRCTVKIELVPRKKHFRKDLPPKTELDANERAFVAAYLESRNATEAALNAGLKRGLTLKRKSAATLGSRLMQQERVRAAILEACVGQGYTGLSSSV